MKLGTGTRVFIGSALLVAVVVGISGAWLSAVLKSRLESSIEQELRTHLQAAREWIEVAPNMVTIQDVDPLTNRLGKATKLRVTVTDKDGLVLGDSDVVTPKVKDIDNHASRPEFKMARETGGVGVARRYSDTVNTDMLYAVTRYSRTDAYGYIRVAKPLAEVNQALEQLRTSLLVAGLLALAMGVMIGGIFSRVVNRTLSRLVLNARLLTDRAISSRSASSMRGDVGALARSITHMSEHLDKVMRTLARERDQFRAVLEGMQEGVIALDSSRRVTTLNESARDLFKFSSSNLGEPLASVCDIPEINELVNQPKLGQAVIREFDIAGTPKKTVMTRLAPLVGSKGVVIVAHDVTEMRRLERIRRDFVANVSHELRTPVSVIHANAETLLDGALENEVMSRKFTEAILRNSERLGSLIADLLDLSRIEAGRFELSLGPIMMNGAATRATESVRIAAERKNIKLDLDIEEDLAATADMRALDQVLLNLVANAIKYTPNDGQVIVRVRGAGERVRIEVEDNGPGIEEKHRGRLFERFYRVDPGRSKDMGGTGLGLAIVKHLVGSMAGNVGMIPAPQQGSIFWVELPADDAPPA